MKPTKPIGLVPKPEFDLSRVYYANDRQDDGPWSPSVFLDADRRKIVVLKLVDGAFYYDQRLRDALTETLAPFGATVSEFVHEGNVLQFSKHYAVTLDGKTTMVPHDRVFLQQIFTVLRDLGAEVIKSGWGEDIDAQTQSPDGSTIFDVELPPTEWQPHEVTLDCPFSLHYTWIDDATAQIRADPVPLSASDETDAIREAETLFADRQGERGPDGFVVVREDGGCIHVFDLTRKKRRTN